MKRSRVFIGILGLIVFLGGCTTVPETGRKQLNLVSADQETQLGLTAFQEMKKEVPVSRNKAVNEMLQRVGRRIASVAQLPNAQWEFVVFESKEANAFCLPGGKVGVYTGLLPITKDEAGLATVVGHEIAHAVARHGGERMSRAMVLQTTGQVLGAATSKAKPLTQAAISTVYGLGAQLGGVLPHSRQQESEADEIGLIYMARAGYNPEAAIDFWGRFSNYTDGKGGGTPWFLRTHPMDEARIKDLRALMPKAQEEYQRARAR